MKQLTKSQFDVLIKKLKKDGHLTASEVLKMAENKSSPLHSLFEWSEEKAAYNYRLMQARTVIKRVNVSIENPGEMVIHVPAIRGEGRYKSAETIVSNISDFEKALSEATSRLTAARASVQLLRGLVDEQSDDNVAILMIAMKGLDTANTALHRLH